MNVHLVVKSTDTARGTLMLRFLVWMKKIKYSYLCLPDPSQNLLCPSLEISVLLYFVQHKHKYLFGNWRGTELNRELKQCLKKKKRHIRELCLNTCTTPNICTQKSAVMKDFIANEQWCWIHRRISNCCDGFERHFISAVLTIGPHMPACHACTSRSIKTF